MRRPFIICYDIVSDRERRQVFTKLSAQGHALQKSVFLVRMMPKEAAQFEGQLTRMISPGDSILVVPVQQKVSLSGPMSHVI
jgi:CRISPR-associated endonuclease Cas2